MIYIAAAARSKEKKRLSSTRVIITGNITTRKMILGDYPPGTIVLKSILALMGELIDIWIL